MCHGLLHQSLIRSWDRGEKERPLGVTQTPVDLFLSNRTPSSSVFCQALGSAGDQSSLSSSSHTTELLQRLFPPLLDALREPKSGLLLCQPPGETDSWGWGNRSTVEDISFILKAGSSQRCSMTPQILVPPPPPPGPAPLALGLCTLQAILLWFWGRAQQHLAAWAPGSFLLLIQKDLRVSS